MRVALWTPAARALAAAAPLIAREHELVFVGAAPSERPAVELDLYELGDAAAYGFVYAALVERPGLVVLERFNLHALVFAETAGRGHPDAYRREARRAQGDIGTFVARQVLAGLGGALPRLVPMSNRALEASLGLVSLDAETAERAAVLMRGRPVLQLRVPAAPHDDDAVALAEALLGMLREIAPGAETARRAYTARRGREATPLGAALEELAWTARELGLAHPPEGVEPLVTPLFTGAR